MKLYLAGGWFNPTSAKRHTSVFTALQTLQNFDIFNPKLNGNITNEKDCDRFEAILKSNIDNIKSSDIVVAITDDKDMGTLWECGFAYAHKKPIIYFCESLDGKPFNLMLAKTGNTVTNISDLLALLKQQTTFIWKESYSYDGVIE